MSDELPGAVGVTSVRAMPQPPRLYWAWVFLFSVFTLGIFWYVWLFIQARWVQRIQGKSFSYGWTIICIVMASISLLVDLAKFATQHQVPTSAGYLDGILFGIYLVTVFALQDELEGMMPDLRLSGAMTFFFGPIYFQYHLQKWGLPGGPLVVATAPAHESDGSVL